MTPKVLRWKPLVVSEIQRGRYPFVAELILSLIHYESRGNAGAVNNVLGASGLIQVIPSTLGWYNQNHPRSRISLASMRGQSQHDATNQIRVGLWVLAKFWRSSHRWVSEQRTNVPIVDLVHFGDAFYAGGPGKVRRMSTGMDRTWSSWEDRYPTSTITKHANAVWSMTEEQSPRWDMSHINRWLLNDDGPTDESPVRPPITPKNGLIAGLLILSIASMAMQLWGKSE